LKGLPYLAGARLFFGPHFTSPNPSNRYHHYYQWAVGKPSNCPPSELNVRFIVAGEGYSSPAIGTFFLVLVTTQSELDAAGRLSLLWGALIAVTPFCHPVADCGVTASAHLQVR
jgi:hypothetical protein